MTVFEKIKSMDIDEFAEWFEENCVHDSDPCINWWAETYCKNCEVVIENDDEYSYCELNNKCRYFNGMSCMPNAKETIVLWLNSDTKEE